MQNMLKMECADNEVSRLKSHAISHAYGTELSLP